MLASLVRPFQRFVNLYCPRATRNKVLQKAEHAGPARASKFIASQRTCEDDMVRDRKEMTQAPWWLQAPQYGDVSHASGTGLIMAGTAVIALPRGDISSITAGIGIFAGSTVVARGRVRRCAHAHLHRRRRVYA